MKYRLGFVILVCLAIMLSCKKSKFGSEELSIRTGNIARNYLVHDGNPDDTEPRVLIIALHGGVGSPKNIEEQSKLSTYADEKGFIACYPEGYKRTWNAYGCCGKAVEEDIDDVQFISDLIDVMILDYNIDPNYVFVTGMSNGGFMSYRLACELSGKIAAIAPVAGSMNVYKCDPSSPVAVMHFHSSEDLNVPYDGGIGDGISDHYNPPIDSVMKVWSSINNCKSASNLVSSTALLDHYEWTNCKDSVSMELYLTHDGGHSWPMGSKPRSKADDVSSAVNANEKMWDFFMAHPKAK